MRLTAPLKNYKNIRDKVGMNYYTHTQLKYVTDEQVLKKIDKLYFNYTITPRI